MIRFFTILFFLLVSVNLFSQNGDTTVTRLEKELASARDTPAKMELLKELIDRTVLTNKSACEQYINQALFLAEETRDRRQMSRIRIHIARAYLSQGGIQSLLDKAESYANEALKISRQESGLAEEEINSMLTLVRVHRNSGRSDKAIEVNTNAITQANDFGNDSLRVICYLAMGRNYLFVDEKLTAFKNYLTALNIADESRHKDKDWLLVSCYRNLAEFFASINNYDKAIDYYKKITDYDRSQKNMTDLMNNTRVIGDYYRADKKFSIANSYFEKSMQMADSLKSYEGKVQGTLSILNNLFASKDYKKGIEYFEQHTEIQQFLNQLNLGFTIDKAKAAIFAELGQFDSAKAYYNKVLPVFERENNPYSKMQFYFEYGYALRKMGRQKEAIESLEKAKQLSEQTNNLEYLKEISAYLDTCHQEIGDYKTAIQYAGLRNKIKDSMEVLSKEKDLVSMEVDAENRRKERKIKEEEEALQRKHNIQYTAIIIGIIVLFILLVSFGFLRVPISWIKVLGFISFIFFFEFIILIADQQIHHATHGEPWKVLGIKVILIAILLPLHHLLEKKVVEMITAQRLKRELNTAGKKG